MRLRDSKPIGSDVGALRGLHEGAAHRIADDARLRLAEERCGLREGQVRAPDEASEHAVGQSDVRVLLEQRRRECPRPPPRRASAPTRSRRRRARDRAARVAGFRSRAATRPAARRGSHEVAPRLPLERRHVEAARAARRAGEARAPRCRARCPTQHHLEVAVAAPQLLDDRDPGEEMSAGAAARARSARSNHAAPPSLADRSACRRARCALARAPSPRDVAFACGVAVSAPSRGRDTLRSTPIAAAVHEQRRPAVATGTAARGPWSAAGPSRPRGS